MRLLVLTAVALAFAAPVEPALAQSEAPRWISRWDQGECQLIRAVGNAERLAIKITPADYPKALPPRDGAWLKHRMRVALLGEKAHD